MQKLLITSILVCYLAFSSGVMVNLHYCMDKLASTQLFSGKQSQCDKCGMHMDDAHGCCRDEVSIVKMDDDQKTTAAVVLTIPSFEQAVVIPSSFIAASFYNFSQPEPDHHHSPPVPDAQQIYLKVNVFRI